MSSALRSPAWFQLLPQGWWYFSQTQESVEIDAYHTIPVFLETSVWGEGQAWRKPLSFRCRVMLS